MRKNIFYRHGWTLVELLITCFIIALLVAIALPGYLTARLKADEAKGRNGMHAVFQAQTEYWFSIDENTSMPRETYANGIDLLDAYMDLETDVGGRWHDGDWRYETDGDDTSFTVTAFHLDTGGADDGLEMTMEQDGEVTRVGAWPY